MKHMVKQPFQDRRAWKKEYVHINLWKRFKRNKEGLDEYL